MESALTFIGEFAAKAGGVFAQIQDVAGWIVSVITIVSTVVALCKAIKEKKIAKIRELMSEFIVQAEEFKCKNGQAVDGAVKKEIVIGKLKTACENFCLKFDEEFWSKLIDEFVEVTRNVNGRK